MLHLSLRSSGGGQSRHEVVSDTGRATHVNAHEVPWVRILGVRRGAIEPAQRHVRIGSGGYQLHLAPRFQSLIESKLSDAICVVGGTATPPEAAAYFARLTLGMVRFRAETEVVRSRQFTIFVRFPIPD